MRRLIVLLCCCIGWTAFAQSSDPALLQSIMVELSQHHSVRAEFTQERQNPALTQAQISKGALLFVLGHGMVWRVREPYQETRALTGSQSVLVDAQGQLKSIRSDRGVSQISQMLQSMLGGNLDDVMRQFNVQADGSAAQWTLRFTPKQARVAHVLTAIQLHGGAFLEGIRIDMQDGTRTDIRMTDPRDAGPLSAMEKHALGLP
jgi:hypothetical protein